jgi:chemotaxis family two-component system sensor kinase Cph1
MRFNGPIDEVQVERIQSLGEQIEKDGRETRRLLDGLVHDLRTVQRGISTSAEILRINLGDASTEETAPTFQRLLESAARMDQILAGVTSYSLSLPAARQSVGRIPLEISVRSALASLDREIRESGAVISQGDLPEVCGNGERLKVLFRNLIDNAIKYRGAENPQIRIDATMTSGESIVSLQDNGIGIDPKYWSNLFVPFKRLHGVEIPGVGLGLAICRKIVETHHGRIWIESEVGRGTTFFFTLPIEGETKGITK